MTDVKVQRLPQLPADAEDRLAALYRGADYRVFAGRHWHRLRFGELAAGLERALPHAGTFALLTAFNPGSRPLPPRRNRQRQQQLASWLRRNGHRWLPGRNAGPAGEWPEPSLLVPGIGAAATDALARRFGQRAVLYWRRGEAVDLRLYRDGRSRPRLSSIKAEPGLHR